MLDWVILAQPSMGDWTEAIILLRIPRRRSAGTVMVSALDRAPAASIA